MEGLYAWDAFVDLVSRLRQLPLEIDVHVPSRTFFFH
jgi:hypothetical protein